MNKLFCIFAVVMSMMFTACEKEEILNLDNQNQEKILAFKSIEEFNNTLAKVNAMSKPERLEWEKQQGFKSFGTICDEFYETIEPTSFINMEEIELFVVKNNDKIQIVNDENGDSFCVTQENENPQRYLMNKNKMFIIANKAFKKTSCKLISVDLIDMEKLLHMNQESETYQKIACDSINDFKIYKALQAVDNTAYKENTIKIGSDNYLIKFWIRTVTLRDPGDVRNQVPNLINYYGFRATEYRVINYARWLTIWWVKRYDSELQGSVTTNDSYNTLQTVTGIDISGGCDDSGYRRLHYDCYTHINASNTSTSYFVSYNLTAKNKEKNLSVTLSK